MRALPPGAAATPLRSWALVTGRPPLRRDSRRCRRRGCAICNYLPDQVFNSALQLAEKVARLANKTHKDRVNEFNSKLEALSEHHDIPKVCLQFDALLVFSGLTIHRRTGRTRIRRVESCTILLLYFCVAVEIHRLLATYLVSYSANISRRISSAGEGNWY